MSSFAQEIEAFVDQGGFVMWPLIALTFVLWYALGYRYLLLFQNRSVNVRLAIQAYQRDPDRPQKGYIDQIVARMYNIRAKHRGNIRNILAFETAPYEEKIGAFSILIRTIVVIAPLAGLLGTVSGMIEMFDSLGDQTFYSQSGGVANGISQALITTQLGLAIAIPGLIAGRLLDRKARRLRANIAQLVETFAEEGSRESP